MKKSLFTILQEIVVSRLTDEALENVESKYSHCTPKTKESIYYRHVFEKHFPKLAKDFVPYFWMPKWTNVTDPSARFISHYAANEK